MTCIMSALRWLLATIRRTLPLFDAKSTTPITAHAYSVAEIALAETLYIAIAVGLAVSVSLSVGL